MEGRGARHILQKDNSFVATIRYMKKGVNWWQFSLILILVVVGIPLFFASARFLWGFVGVNIDVGTGDRVAKIIKVSEKGWIWKTWEGEAVLTQGDLVATYVWSFSIDNDDPIRDELVNKMRQAFESGEVVKIHYNERAGFVPWRSKTSYFLKEIRFDVLEQ